MRRKSILSHLFESKALQLIRSHVEFQLSVKVPIAVLIDRHEDRGLFSIHHDLNLAALARVKEAFETAELANLEKGKE